MIWFWISLVAVIAWAIAWLTGGPDGLLWGLTMLWLVTLNIWLLRGHKYPPKPVRQDANAKGGERRAEGTQKKNTNKWRVEGGE